MDFQGSTVEKLLSCFGCKEAAWLGLSQAKEIKKKIKFLYSQDWPDAPERSDVEAFGRWNDASSEELLMDVTFDDNCELRPDKAGASSILVFRPNEWPTAKKLRVILEQVVSGTLEITDSELDWHLICQSEPNYTGFVNLRFASKLGLSRLNSR